MTGQIALLLALLPAGICAQNATLPNQTAPPDPLGSDPGFQRLSTEKQALIRALSGRVDAAVEQKDPRAIEQLTLEMAQRELMGTQFCGEHVVNGGTFIDAFARNQSHEEAFAVRWLDREPGMTVHTAVFTNAGRCVVSDGERLEDGKTIASVMPNSLAVSQQHGFVAYEAEYWNSPVEHAAGGAVHRGIFIENRFLAELDPRNASAPFSLNVNEQQGDFRWSARQEGLDLRPGVVLPLTPAALPAAGARATVAGPALAPSRQSARPRANGVPPNAQAPVAKSPGRPATPPRQAAANPRPAARPQPRPRPVPRANPAPRTIPTARPVAKQ